ncbi:MAG: metalloregulator ArsR/SmtB family transcription factor [Pseudomonadota bacterium]
MKLDPSEMFKVLAVETRVKIIELLKSQGPLGAKNIAEQLGITPAAVSQHLKILRQAGLARSERKGYWIPYSIDEEALENCGQLLNQICTCGCGGTGDFKKQELHGANLKSLKDYERELKNEIITVRERIKELNSKKG